MAALLGMFLGVVLALVPTLAICYRRTRELARVVAERPLVPPETYAALDVLRSAAIVVGPHDEILHSTAPARTTGLVRGTRIGIGALLDAVRSARLRGQPSGLDMRLSQGPGTPPRELTVRVAPLGRQVVLVVADDRSAEVRVESTKRDLVANISHELKTPVGAIKLLSEAVADASDDPEAVARVEQRHQSLETALERFRLLRHRAFEASIVLLAAAVVLTLVQPTLALGVLAVGVVGVLVTFVFRARVEAAQRLAGRVLSGAVGKTDAEKVGLAFRLCLTRDPAPAERNRLESLVKTTRSWYENHPAEAVEFAGKTLPEGSSAVEVAAWTATLRVLLNLDEFLTRS